MLNRLQEEIHEFYLCLRMLDRMVQSEEFERAYESAVDFSILKEALDTLNFDQMKLWIILNSDPGELSLRELRKVARFHNIPGWSRLEKFELVTEVEDARRNRRHNDIAYQVKYILESGEHKSKHSDRRSTYSQQATVHRRVGLFRVSAEAIELAESGASVQTGPTGDVAELPSPGDNGA